MSLLHMADDGTASQFALATPRLLAAARDMHAIKPRGLTKLWLAEGELEEGQVLHVYLLLIDGVLINHLSSEETPQ